jgi:hypothetical protein
MVLARARALSRARDALSMRGEEPMAISEGGPVLVQIEGHSALLVERLRDPLRRALGGRRTFYSVRVETLGRVGEVLISIRGAKGHLPLLLKEEELDPGYVATVVRDTVNRFGL